MPIPNWLIFGISMESKVKVFVDTNVLLDVLCSGRRGSRASEIVFQAVKDGILEGVLSTQSLVDASYILCQGKISDELGRSFLSLMHIFNICHADMFCLRDAIRQPLADLEDAVQFACAQEQVCDVFLTRDKEFIQSHTDDGGCMCFLSPEEFVSRIS